jgi:hypothetical protein
MERFREDAHPAITNAPIAAHNAKIMGMVPVKKGSRKTRSTFAVQVTLDLGFQLMRGTPGQCPALWRHLWLVWVLSKIPRMFEKGDQESGHVFRSKQHAGMTGDLLSDDAEC